MTEIIIYTPHYQNKNDLLMSEMADEFETLISNQTTTANSKSIDKYCLAVNGEEGVFQIVARVANL